MKTGSQLMHALNPYPLKLKGLYWSRLRMLAILILYFLSGDRHANAGTYYFSMASGDDSRTPVQAQNTATPWKTIAKFNSYFSSFQPGDVILFNRGEEFAGGMLISRSGTAASPITIGSYGTGAMPIISGFTTLSGWTLNDGLYEASLPNATLNMVLFNGAFQPIGRWPKSGYLAQQSHSGTTAITSSAISSAGSFTSGELVTRPVHWILQRGTINTQTATSITTSPFLTPIGAVYQPIAGYGFFFQNHPRACTLPGDWCYDGAAHKIKVNLGTGNAVVKASTTDMLVTIASRSYITFTGISFQGANIDAFKITSSDHISILGCNISFTGQDGIWVNASPNTVIENTTLNFTNNNGITGNNNASMTIRGNVFSNTGMVAGMGVSGDGQYQAMAYIGANSLIELNTLVNTGYVGIHFVGANTIVQKNLVYQFCAVKDDGGGIYSWSNGQSGSKVLNNIVLNGVGAAAGTTDAVGTAEGIYMDDNVTGVEIAYNTVANMPFAGLLLHNANKLNIHDNTFYDNGAVIYKGGQAYYSNGAGTMASISLAANIFFSRKALQDVTNIDPAGSSLSWMTSNNNYFCRPLNEKSCFSVNLGGFKHVDLPGWVALSGQDKASKSTPIAVSDTNKIRFEYNATQLARVVPLDGTYIDVKATEYPGSITLQPFSSAVLLFKGSVITPPPVIYQSSAKSGSFTRNNCGSGQSGSTVIYSVPGSAYSSSLSQADADSKAAADVSTNGQAFANQTGTCTIVPPTIYYNMQKAGAFTRNNCPAGSAGSSVTYTVVSGKYTSSISQADADAKAISDVSTNGQAFANANGTCSAVSKCSFWDKVFKRKGCKL